MPELPPDLGLLVYEAEMVMVQMSRGCGEDTGPQLSIHCEICSTQHSPALGDLSHSRYCP